MPGFFRFCNSTAAQISLCETPGRPYFYLPQSRTMPAGRLTRPTMTAPISIARVDPPHLLNSKGGLRLRVSQRLGVTLSRRAKKNALA
jgi:hypothetical protein